METNNKKRLNRRERRNSLHNDNQEKQSFQTKNSLNLIQIQPLNENQSLVFDGFNKLENLLLIGSAGTGKTFLAIYLALRELLISKNTNNYEKIYIVRSAEPTKSIGFLKGSLGEKTKVYEAPYYSIFTELFGRGDAYDIFKNRRVVEFVSTSYIRGLTLKNCIIVVDECQNLEWNEIYAMMTRLGDNSRIILCGDYKQSDLKNVHRDDRRKEDVLKLIAIVRQMKSFKTIEFGTNDIVRSDVVKEFIILSESMDL